MPSISGDWFFRVDDHSEGGGSRWRLGQNKQVEREGELPSKLHCTYSATLVYTPAQAGIGAGAMASLGKVRMAPARKTNYPTHRHPTGPNPITAPILRHIGITTDVRKGRLDGLFVVFPLLVIRKSLRIKS